MSAADHAAAVRFDGVCKKYGEFEALHDVSFDVPRGKVTALLGPNGAGKSTLIDILGGVCRPTSGAVIVDGEPVTGPGSTAPGVLGIMLQEAGFIPELTVGETAESWSRFTGGDPRTALERVGLDTKTGTRVAGLSGGERRRLDLAIALMGDPEIVVLDEPTTGMDPDSRRHAIDLIGDLAATTAMTVILTTHLLEEAQQLADSVVILRGGRVLLHRDTAESDHHDSSIRFTPTGERRAEFLQQLCDLQIAVAAHGQCSVTVADPQRALLRLLTTAEQTAVNLTGLTVRPQTIEDLYFRTLAAESEPVS